MMTPFPPKTPMQMRREAEAREKPQSSPASGPADPSKRSPELSRRVSPLHCDTGAEISATIEWLAHVHAGRIEVK